MCNFEMNRNGMESSRCRCFTYKISFKDVRSRQTNKKKARFFATTLHFYAHCESSIEYFYSPYHCSLLGPWEKLYDSAMRDFKNNLPADRNILIHRSPLGIKAIYMTVIVRLKTEQARQRRNHGQSNKRKTNR